jgi:hypothetical protein
MLAGRLRPDVSHPHSPPLPSFALVLFDQRQQFLIAVAFVHTVKALSLTPRLK